MCESKHIDKLYKPKRLGLGIDVLCSAGKGYITGIEKGMVRVELDIPLNGQRNVAVSRKKIKIV